MHGIDGRWGAWSMTWLEGTGVGAQQWLDLKQRYTSAAAARLREPLRRRRESDVRRYETPTIVGATKEQSTYVLYFLILKTLPPSSYLPLSQRDQSTKQASQPPLKLLSPKTPPR